MAVAVSNPRDWTSELARSMGWTVTSVTVTMHNQHCMEAEIVLSKPLHDDVYLNCPYEGTDTEKAVHEIVDGYLGVDGCLSVYDDKLVSS